MIIDELFVKIGLDQAGFTEDQRKAVDGFRRTQELFQKGGDNIERSAKKAGVGVGELRTAALQLFAAFEVGKGLYDFTAGLVNVNAELGRVSRSTNVSVNDISKWQGAAEVMGGDAKAMAGTIVQLSDAFQGLSVGQISPTISLLRSISAAGGDTIEPLDDVNTKLIKLAHNLEIIDRKNPGQGGFLARQLGLDSGTTDMLLRGEEFTRKILAITGPLGATQRDADAAQAIQQRLAIAALNAKKSGRGVVTPGAEAASNTVDYLSNNTSEQLVDGAIAQFKAEYAKSGFFGAWYNLATGNASSSIDKLGTPAEPIVSTTPRTDAEREAYIRRAAAKRGLDPNVMVRVWESEGKNGVGPSQQSTVIGRNGKREESYGPYQFYMGGGVGNEFVKSTGLDPRDPSTWTQQVDFAMDKAKATGLGPWHGWKGSPFAGGAGQGGGNTTTVTVGSVTINAGPQAGGAEAGQTFSEYIKRQAFTAQANSGQQ